uniref:Uncharacterized protein n=1 Tax=Romanomermis culicivorax TaxID=13658 RepID=A0A915IGV7_ROMCU
MIIISCTWKLPTVPLPRVSCYSDPLYIDCAVTQANAKKINKTGVKSWVKANNLELNQIDGEKKITPAFTVKVQLIQLTVASVDSIL